MKLIFDEKYTSRGATATRRSCRSLRGQTRAPNLEGLLADSRTSSKSSIRPVRPRRRCETSACWPRPVYCTKIASKLARTYTDRHGLKDLVQRAARPRDLQAAAVVGLGRGRARARRSSLTPPRTCCTSTPCAKSSTPCWSARVATASPAPPSPIFPSARASISPASRRDGRLLPRLSVRGR